MDAVELKIHRANTAAFIAQRPTSISLTPVEHVRTASRGFSRQKGAPRTSQTFRVVEQPYGAAPVLQLTDGEQRQAPFFLLGLHTALVEINDEWTAPDGREWTVTDVIRSNGYEVRALVVENGK